MYEFVDRPVAALDAGGRVLLAVTRDWVSARRRGLDAGRYVAPRFAAAGAEAARIDFDAGMARLEHALGRRLIVAPAGCRHIAEGEAVLLALWGDLGAGRHEAALAVLRLMLPVAAADLVAVELAAAADHLRAAGLLAGHGTSYRERQMRRKHE